MKKINWNSVFIIIPFAVIMFGLGYITYTNFEFLNQNNGAINVLFAGVVAVSTLIYAMLTWRLVDETKEMRKAQTEPNICVTIEPREEWINFIDMKIMNIGSGPAYDIKFKIEPDFEYFKGKFLSKIKLMQGIKYLPPNQKIQFFLTSLVENFNKKTGNPFQMGVSYKNKTGDKLEETFTIDFSQFEGMSQLGEPPLHKMAKSLDSIQRDVGHLSSGFHRLKTIIYTKKDIDNGHKQMMKRIKNKKEKNAPTTKKTKIAP